MPYPLIILALTLALQSHAARADVLVEESGSKAIFKINGKDVTPIEAQAKATDSNARIMRCSPIKDAYTTDGKGAYRCKQVNLVINPKTGTTKWKNL